MTEQPSKYSPETWHAAIDEITELNTRSKEMQWRRNPDGRHQPLIKHEHHAVEVRNSTRLPGQCYYYCRSCRVHVAWLSKRDSALAKSLGLVV